jgi:hypothetical protein
MPAQPLRLEVLRNGRPSDEFDSHGDPEDKVWLQKRLQGWLEAKKWDKSHWGEFEIVARASGRNKRLGNARAV